MTLVTLPSATAMSSPCNGPKWNRCTALARASALRAFPGFRASRLIDTKIQAHPSPEDGCRPNRRGTVAGPGFTGGGRLEFPCGFPATPENLPATWPRICLASS